MKEKRKRGEYGFFYASMREFVVTCKAIKSLVSDFHFSLSWPLVAHHIAAAFNDDSDTFYSVLLSWCVYIIASVIAISALFSFTGVVCCGWWTWFFSSPVVAYVLCWTVLRFVLFKADQVESTERQLVFLSVSEVIDALKKDYREGF